MAKTTAAPQRGHYAKLTAGTDRIEIKATVPQRAIANALKRYKLTRSNDEQRLVYFFDTPDQSLLKAGIIVRARRVIGDQHDSTIKFRPVDADKLPQDWRKYAGFKIEVDASEKGLVKSASFSMPVRKGLIKQVVAGKERNGKLFTPEQEKFLEDTVGRNIDFDHVVVLGPLKAQRWDFEDPACPWPITAELWQRADGAQLMEISVKAPTAQAAAVMAGFMAFLTEVGAERDRNQQAKTRWAMDFYAAKRKPAARRRLAASAAVKSKVTRAQVRARKPVRAR
jgi:hypothetical protein